VEEDNVLLLLGHGGRGAAACVVFVAL
jgi:hypothetical protein